MGNGLGQHLSLWRDVPEVHLATTTHLADVRADVVVAGAGITGMTAALLLQQDGLRVAVIEAARVGQNAVTTHSTVKVTVGHGTSLSRIRDARGERAAEVYAQANQAGLASVLETVDGLGIECDLEAGVPHVVYAERRRGPPGPRGGGGAVEPRASRTRDRAPRCRSPWPGHWSSRRRPSSTPGAT